MITEQEFNFLRVIREKAFIKREDFESDEEFDYACELAREMLDQDLVLTHSTKPFVMNNTGQGAKYGIAGKFSISTTAQDIVKHESYREYVKKIPKPSEWSLANRLAAYAAIATLLSAAVAFIVD